MFEKSYALPILNILVPHLGQTPWVAGLPFFMVTDLAFFISLLVRHFMQYACIKSPSLIFTTNDIAFPVMMSNHWMAWEFQGPPPALVKSDFPHKNIGVEPAD